MNQTVEFFTTGDPYLIETVLNAVMMALDAGGLGAEPSVLIQYGCYNSLLKP